MSDESNPRPWRVNSVTGGHISDANGDPVCFCVGSDCGERAAFIVAAVNERDRLRDIVRRLCDELESHYYEPQSMNDRSVIRQARAALGEGGLA